MGEKRSLWQWLGYLFLIVIGVLIVMLVFKVLQVNGTGFDATTTKTVSQATTTSRTTITTTTMYQPGKTLWDWLGLLAVLAIPIMVGFGAAWFTTQQGKVSDRENRDNQRETALQKYIDSISELLLKENLRKLTPEGKLIPENEDVRKIARVRTLTILRRLDAKRKKTVLEFLQESSLIEREMSIITFEGADLSGADLNSLILNKTNLILADLSGASLHRADLSGADLRGVDLRGVDLREANLRETDLRGADLRGASLRRASLRGADLSGPLPWGKFYETRFNALAYRNFLNPNPTGANLRGASGTTPVQLAEAKSLRNATMHNGSIHP